ncbi:MAG: DUF2802 domain-containing protein [Woeseia sp.]
MIIDEGLAIKAMFISNALLLGALIITILHFQRLLQKSVNLLSSVASVGLKAKCEETESVDARIRALQKVAEEMSCKESMQQPANLHETPYENAVRMAKSGARVDELTTSCGLKKGEAELLLRLHATAGI